MIMHESNNLENSMEIIPSNHWIIGSNGVYHGTPRNSWTRVGAQEYGNSSLIREPNRLLAGASWGSGLWEWTENSDRWKQLHDETLTEVIAIASIGGNPGLIAGSPYGVATGSYDEIGAVRWTHHSDTLQVNERFTNAILVHPRDTSTWLIGTESGVIVTTNSGSTWKQTTITDTPVRALIYGQNLFWAGTDNKGIWCSEDGIHWLSVGHTVDGGAIFGLSEAGNSILAGTEHGVAIGDSSGKWNRMGPRYLCASVACHPRSSLSWLSGGAPGGLWYTQDGGEYWYQIEGFVNVHSILAPREA